MERGCARRSGHYSRRYFDETSVEVSDVASRFVEIRLPSTVKIRNYVRITSGRRCGLPVAVAIRGRNLTPNLDAPQRTQSIVTLSSLSSASDFNLYIENKQDYFNNQIIYIVYYICINIIVFIIYIDYFNNMDNK